MNSERGVVTTISPATGAILAEYQWFEKKQAQAVLEKSQTAFLRWRRTDLKERLAAIHAFGLELKKEKTALSSLITAEMGKTLLESEAEVDKSADAMIALVEMFPQWKAQHERRFKSENRDVEVRRAPLGPVLGIMPWNYPLWQVLRFAAPALLCGNTVLLKHAPCTFGVAERINEIMTKVLPDGVYSNLNLHVEDVPAIIRSPLLRGVSLTGSRVAGVNVSRLTGGLLKKCVLELGGSDPYLILDDADVELAARTCVKSRFLNAGQSCISPKRWIVGQKNAERFLNAVMPHLEKLVAGDPLVRTTRLAPMARPDLRETLHEQVQMSLRQGAKLVCGGEIPKGPGFYYPATLLTEVKPGQVAFDHELFGPVASVIVASSEDEIFKLANQTPYGLGAAIFSSDVERARARSADLDVGMVAINDFVRSSVDVPFGGSKDSGLGRELGLEGSFEFTNIKSVLG